MDNEKQFVQKETTFDLREWSFEYYMAKTSGIFQPSKRILRKATGRN